MRHWLFHPIIFYPLAILFAMAVIALSVQPQGWPRPPAPIAGLAVEDTLVLEGAAFNAPDPGVGQQMTVVRDFWGRPQSLRIAQIPNQPTPLASEHGVRVLLVPASAAVLQSGPVAVEVTYNPLAINSASALAVSLRGAGATEWLNQLAPPQPGILRFEFPATVSATAIGLRALSSGTDQAYGLEITRIKVSPRTLAPTIPVEPAPPPGN